VELTLLKTVAQKNRLEKPEPGKTGAKASAATGIITAFEVGNYN
jgi:hypothetical protein